METVNFSLPAEKKTALYRQAAALAVFTIAYNLVEGGISVFFGFEDETLALFGFGLDSFVEVISGAGILHMVLRLRSNGGTGDGGRPDTGSEMDRFEATALRITGGAFYLLFAGLLATVAFALYQGHAPETTFWGVVVSLVSIVTMWALIRLKVRVGRALGSAAILADAACTRACLYLSVILLVTSLGYEFTGIGGLDAIGAAAIAVLSLKEGREAFEMARGGSCSCSNGSCLMD